ncbi:MAG: N-acetyl-gamma-glutamyl-phosphate reductase [Thermoleophilia bacterium]|nr:N-acetyl-gamma-glutamyl-phosphate reductase [Thermoleophilia bacterium]
MVIKAGIVGATGYTGAVLTDLLAEHPYVRLEILTSQSYAGLRVREVFPYLRVEHEYTQYAPDLLKDCDVAFVCYPHGEAHQVVAELVDQGCRVVDLSADFRLRDAGAYQDWYGFVHPRPELVQEAVYGLPEIYRESIRKARIVANPGCYPTALLLAVLPAIQELSDDVVIVDAKSGVSGAGRKPSDKTHFCSVTENFRSYSEVGHRHTSEMVQELSLAAGKTIHVSFTPHLLPVDRGIQEAIYLRVDRSSLGTQTWLERYREFYAGEPFVEVCEHVPSLREVQYTNYCRLAVREDPQTGLLKVFSVIDNLVKGASGQAVQNMNVMFDFPETAGLLRRV